MFIKKVIQKVKRTTSKGKNLQFLTIFFQLFDCYSNTISSLYKLNAFFKSFSNLYIKTFSGLFTITFSHKQRAQSLVFLWANRCWIVKFKPKNGKGSTYCRNWADYITFFGFSISQLLSNRKKTVVKYLQMVRIILFVVWDPFLLVKL